MQGLALVAGRFARVEPMPTAGAADPDPGFSAHASRRSTEQLSESLPP